MATKVLEATALEVWKIDVPQKLQTLQRWLSETRSTRSTRHLKPVGTNSLGVVVDGQHEPKQLEELLAADDEMQQPVQKGDEAETDDEKRRRREQQACISSAGAAYFAGALDDSQ